MKIQSIVGYYDSNTFVLEEGGATIIIDAGAKLSDLLVILGNRKPDAIFLTHEHFDHTYYLADYKKEFGCPIYLPSGDNEIVVRNIVVKPILCPGHSPKSVVYLIGENLFTGDVLFADSIGRTDFTSGAKPSIANPQERLINDLMMQEALKQLQGVKFKVAWHGHYEPSLYEEQQKNIRRFLK